MCHLFKPYTVTFFLPLTIPSLRRFFEVITVSEMRNITIDGNVTELQGVVTYDITELRMNPNYIRCLSKIKI